jgi:hypothetical protein
MKLAVLAVGPGKMTSYYLDYAQAFFAYIEHGEG